MALVVLGRAVGVVVQPVLLVHEVLDPVEDALVVHDGPPPRAPSRLSLRGRDRGREAV